MIRKHLLQLLVLSVKWGHFLGVNPFRYDTKKNCVFLDKRRTFKCKRLLSITGQVASILFLIFRLIQEIISGRKNNTVVLTVLLIIAFSMSLIVQFPIFLLPNLAAAQANTLLSLVPRFQEKYCKRGLRLKLGIADMMVPLFVFTALQHPILMATVGIIRPNYSFRSIVPEEYENNVAVVITFFLIDLWIQWNFWALNAFFLILAVVYFFFTKFVLEELKLGKKHYRTYEELRSLENIIHMTHILKIMNVMILEIGKDVLAAFHFMVSRASLLCNLLVVIFTRGKRFNVLIVTVIILYNLTIVSIWYGVLQFMGGVYTKSRSCINSWKYFRSVNPKEVQLMKMFKAASRPCRMQQGDYRIMKKLSAMDFLISLTRGTFRALMAAKR